jgi:hypothetical protein
MEKFPAVVLTALVEGQSSPYAISIDETAIYWTDRGDGTIRKLAR